MEKSTYNFIIKEREYNLIYNSFSNILLEVDDRIIKYLDSYKTSNSYAKHCGISPSEYKELIEWGILCDNIENQKQKILRNIHTGIQYRIGSRKDSS